MICGIIFGIPMWFWIASTPYRATGELIQAICENDLVALEEMLESGYDPNTPDFFYKGAWKYVNRFAEDAPSFALCTACREGNPEAVKLLLDYGADPVLTEGDDFDWSAMSCAVMASEDEDCIEIVNMLLDHGARIDNTGDYYLPVVLASYEYPHLSDYTEEEAQRHAERIVELVELLIGDMDVNMDNGTLLAHAVRMGNLPLTEYLLSIGADPYLPFYDTGTAYDLAVKWERHEVADYLSQWMAQHPQQ